MSTVTDHVGYGGESYGYFYGRRRRRRACVFFVSFSASRRENRRALKRDARRRTTTTMGDEGRTTKGEDGDDCDLYHALGLARDATKLEVRFGWVASRRARKRALDVEDA